MFWSLDPSCSSERLALKIRRGSRAVSSTGLKTSSSRGTGILAALGTSKPRHKDRVFSVKPGTCREEKEEKFAEWSTGGSALGAGR